LSSGHAASPHDPEASLRAELSAKIAGAQSDIASKLTELRNSLASAQGGLAITQAESQLRGLSTLQQRIGIADANGLSAIRSEVAATVAATQALVQQAQQGTSAAQSAQVALAQASEAARNSVNDFMHGYYDRHEFDRYLQFSTQKDEEEYRRREAERKQAIDAAMAQHTPQGDLKANQLSIDQLKDAGAHGANRSPEYKPMLDGLEKTREQLASQLSSKGSKEQAAETGPTKAAPVTPLPADVLARLKGANVALADQTQEGHGVADKGAGASTVRTL